MRARVAAAVAVVVASGCGDGDGERENALRPPAPIVVTASIDGERVRVSPPRFGAGPVTFVISNQSGSAQRVTFETDEIAGRTGGIRRSTGSIEPRGTAELKADPRQGSYRLAVTTRAIEPARIEVTRRRRSAQDALLQP